MKFIDGILPPNTIRGVVRVRDGMAYWTLGNFIGFLKPSNVTDMRWEAV